MDNADFHRFELMDKLEVGGSAQAKVLIWDIPSNDWIWNNEIISVRDWDGRHFGLPGERGLAKCWGDSHKSEITELGGLVRFGKLLGNLTQGGNASFDIYNNADGGGGHQIMAFHMPRRAFHQGLARNAARRLRTFRQ